MEAERFFRQWLCGTALTELGKTQVAKAILKLYWGFFHFFQVLNPRRRMMLYGTNKADKSNKDFF